MSDVRLTTTPAAGLRRLEAHGQPVVAMHRQFAAILGNRLGRQHAQILARPEIDPGDGRIDWYAPPLGAVRRLAEIGEAERQPIETLRRELIAEIGRLAVQMRGEGDSAALVAHMLDLAVITPPDAAVYAVGAQPVLVLWGHAAETQAVPEAPPPPQRAMPRAVPAAEAPAVLPAAVQPSPATAGAATAGAAAQGAATEGSAVAAMGAPAAGRGRRAWLLPLFLLLLLAFLLWRALQPLPPVVFERPLPASPPAADPVAPETEKEKLLRAELARLTQERDQQLALCKPLAPMPPAAPVAPPQPPKVTDVPSPEPQEKTPPPAKAEAKPKATPPKTPPKTPEPPKSQAKAPPPKPEEPGDLALAPPIPPAPPKSACKLDVRPGDEPEVIVVVDASGSMEESIPGSPSRMAAAKGAIEQVVTGLPPEVEIGLVDFTDCNQIRVDDFYPNARRPALIGQVRGLQPERRTALARSLERAGSRASSSADSTIVVVTDGEDSCGGDPCGVAASIRRRKPNVTINVIDVSGAGSSTAQCIARNGGGKVLTPNSAMDMKTKVQQATRLPDTRTCK